MSLEKSQIEGNILFLSINKYFIGKYEIVEFKFSKSQYLFMVTKVKDLTVDELKSIITETVKGTIEDLIEDVLALSSQKYLKSIEEARNDYKKGDLKSLEEISDV